MPKMDPKSLEKYGILESRGRKYENIALVLALIYGTLFRELSKSLSPYGLSPSKYNIMLALAFQNEGRGLSQVKLASHLIVTPGNITKLIDGLVKDGLATRRVNPDSRRENVIRLTKEGRELVDTAWPAYDGLVSGLVSLLPEKYHERTAEALGEWFNALQNRKS